MVKQWDKIKEKETDPQKELGYFRAVKKMVYSIAIVIPLALIYELSSLMVNRSFFEGIRSSAEVWILKFLRFLGLPLYLPLSILFIIVWVLIYVFYRRKGNKLNKKYFLWMFLEAMAFAVLFGLVAGMITGLILPHQMGPANMISVSFGAGLYEELIFRVLLIPLFFWIFRKFGTNKIFSWGIAVVISSFLFALIHHIGTIAEPFTISAFTYRFVSGCIFALLYVTRGFGITAWTHAMYDIYVIIGVFEFF